MKNTTDFNVGDQVIFTPPHLIGSNEPVLHENCGRVTSTNDTYVFVSFMGNSTSHACKPESLQKEYEG
jgi:hypothetical protein